MIYDIRDRAVGSSIQADLIIIGGGLAGITLAREFANSTTTVAIIESGGREQDKATQDLYAGKGRLVGPDSAEVSSDEYLGGSRARFYGGSGNWWGGKCVPLDPVDFEEKPWIPGSGWPMSRADLQPYYDRACDVLSIPHFDKDYSEPQHEGRPPLDINGSKHITSLPRDHSPVTGRNKERFDEFRYGFTKAKNISVYLFANVVDFNLDSTKSQIISVEVKALPRAASESNKKKRREAKAFTVRGGKFVLACGGIENARLLLASRLPKRSDAIGRYFQGHTVVGAEAAGDHSGSRVEFAAPQESLGLYVDRRPGPPHAVLGTTRDGQSHYRSAGFTVTIGRGAPPLKGDELAIQSMATRVDAADPSAKSMTSCWCYFMTENFPNPESRVTLGGETDALGMPRATLRWEYGGKDMDSLERSIDAFAQELGSASLGRVSMPIEKSEFLTNMSPSRHHIGTTRMHRDPTRGVVDADLKMHDTDNLYIAGSSVFPTSGIANPTLTILALTIRLSDHLKKAMGAQ